MSRQITFRVFRMAYRYPLKTNGSRSDFDYCGARLSLTLP